MSDDKIRMTRQQMQDHALVIECLLGAALAMGDEDMEDVFCLIQKAQCRAKRLQKSLDLINEPEIAA